MSNEGKCQSPEVVAYEDLGASVYTSHVPESLADELAERYGTLRSTLDWFVLWEGLEPTGVCVLEEPHHVLVFHVWSDTLELLNKCIRIEPSDVRRACKALFRALPLVRRIRLEIPFRARELDLPVIVRGDLEYMIAELPATFDEYLASLGASTRRNLRLYENRLKRDFPRLVPDAVVVGQACVEIADLFLGWKIARFEQYGLSTYWETEPQRYPGFVRLVCRRGEARVVTIEGEVAAMVFAFWVGDEVYALQSSFDPRYEKYHLGLLMHLWLAREAVARGAKRMNIGRGSSDYKVRLGAKPVNTQQVSIYRSRISRLRAFREAPKFVARRQEARDYWGRVRHRVGQPIKFVLRRAHRREGP